jgi:hypothetical protein
LYSYGTPAWYHIPYTDLYLDFLVKQISESLIVSGMDGFMIDWFWPVPQSVRDQENKGKWLETEKSLYQQLTGQVFPGEGNLTNDELFNYERKSLVRVWNEVYKAVKGINTEAKIWLSTNNITDQNFRNSVVYKEIDWIMDESGDPNALRSVLPELGAQTECILCLSWSGVPAEKIIEDPKNANFGLYGFTSPGSQTISIPMCADVYLHHPIQYFTGVPQNVATLARYYNGLPFTYVNTTPPDPCPQV